MPVKMNLDKLSSLMAIEYKEVADSGLQLRLDCPDLALARHMIFKKLSEKNFLIMLSFLTSV